MHPVPLLGRGGPLLVLLTLLASCATPPTPLVANPAAWQARQTALSALSHWRTAGRIGVVSGQDGWHANFQWEQQSPDYRIDLSGPLGQGRVVVQGAADTVSVQTQDGQRWSAADADTVLEQSLGVQLPVNGLRYWIRGLPAPGSTPPQLQTDAQGRLTRLEQNGWIIEYASYTTVGSLELPGRITARRSDLSVKLLIEQWTL